MSTATTTRPSGHEYNLEVFAALDKHVDAAAAICEITEWDQRSDVKKVAQAKMKAGSGITGAQRRQLRVALRGIDDTMTELYRTNSGLVGKYVNQFTRVDKTQADDLEAAGNLGLQRAINSFNPSKGVFSSWAYRTIQREVLTVVRQLDHQNLSQGDFESRPLVLRSVKGFRDGGVESPTVEQVAEDTGLTADKVHRIMFAPRLDSLDAAMSPGGDDDGSGSLADMLETDDIGVESSVLYAMDIAAVRQIGLPELTAREVFVVARRFGLDGEPPARLSSIGATLGSSREAVRIIQNKAMSKLGHPRLMGAILEVNTPAGAR